MSERRIESMLIESDKITRVIRRTTARVQNDDEMGHYVTCIDRNAENQEELIAFGKHYLVRPQKNEDETITIVCVTSPIYPGILPKVPYYEDGETNITKSALEKNFAYGWLTRKDIAKAEQTIRIVYRPEDFWQNHWYAYTYSGNDHILEGPDYADVLRDAYRQGYRYAAIIDVSCVEKMIPIENLLQ